MQQPASEIDKAIELLIALKSARPASFSDAMARISSAPGPGEGDEAAHASSLALGLLKGPFGQDSSSMFMELSSKLPKTPAGALGLSAAKPGPATSVGSRALRAHGLASPWIRFLLQAMRDGRIPQDPDCAFDLACRLEESVEDGGESSAWLGTPDAFHEALRAFFSWECDWRGLSEQTRLDFLPWILQYWLHEGGPASYDSALRACRSLMAQGAASGLSASSWLEFARPTHAEHAEASVEAMSQCLSITLGAGQLAPGEASLLFCKLASPTPWMAPALRAVLAADPQGPSALDEGGLSCAYFINDRVGHHDNAQWQRPLLQCFEALVEAGADPRLIAPQRALASIAKHPTIAAAVEAAEIEDSAQEGGPDKQGRRAL